ncbi:ADP-ribosylglycohydrolase [Paraburkholderia sp. BL6669N2]|uniref:ADP-ribosylglycohydrolase family protein n=1 Tax=Paraburkholderia sp. BL6669N2 TaxID=1938807 RepID=UPI000E23E7AD|nr:ADP-ribosylglycohydrolase family protein [Paraburkholderia sp. BL6669N2]REG60068.1 ADP-ribosylglycohydrolase [Paraburkholderia sp. BL6669N2]
MTSKNGFASLTQYRQFDAVLGGLVGLLVGDAIGVAFEFKTPNLIPPRDQIEMTMAATFRRSHAGVPAGTWSDDGAQALCLLASLLDCGKLSLIDFAGRLLRWRDDGYLAVDGDVFDIGIQTADALNRLRDGASPRESGGAAVMENGNGSVMRVLPLALWHTGPDEELARNAHLQSIPTHAHPRSLVACAFYVLVARGYLRKTADPWSWAVQRLEEIYNDWQDQHEQRAFLRELDVLRSFPKTDTPRGTGYVIDTIWSARKALEGDTFEDVIRTAIQFGNDTDTSAAVAGGLAGILFGLGGIPTRWLQQLRGFNLVEPLIGRWLQESE